MSRISLHGLGDLIFLINICTKKNRTFKWRLTVDVYVHTFPLPSFHGTTDIKAVTDFISCTFSIIGAAVSTVSSSSMMYFVF
jgi:hypothetical protein